MVGDRIPKLAVLINTDNARSSIVNFLLSEITKYGTAHAKRAYGDWTRPNLLNSLSNRSNQSSTIIIDAMDLLYSGQYNRFCLVSTDSDFTRLAACIRESGLIVMDLESVRHSSPLLLPVINLCPLKISYILISLCSGQGSVILASALQKNILTLTLISYRYYKLSDLITVLSLFKTARRSL
ncbi:NYN domain-containing protein [Aspergillus alliaceus]|uniref:NYN domain-containing protein n=1 Tax=Petromyces alliaceus TaxID=209559 RepID=UPI0012A3C4EC|nr:uncharacterized protein BDW43DRAFT_319094 [Aspergillus alliaceus]KAB8234041.1 hypothetical protein BDW43DRAFT_319094 [Aspergillus alliaceus]